MLILQIKQAETALRDGRLDEAYSLLSSPELRAHRRGQDLIGRLSRALIERGQRHLTESRTREAAADCEKARVLGGNLPETAELQKALQKAIEFQQHCDRAQNDVVATAREHIEAGRLSMADGVLASGQVDSLRTAELKNRAAALRTRGEAAIAALDTALAHADWDAAVRALLEAQRTHAGNARLPELAARVQTKIADVTTAAIDRGALDTADALLRLARPVKGSNVRLSELAQRLEMLQESAAMIAAGRLREAADRLTPLASLLPNAAWLKNAVDSLNAAVDGLDAVRGGPLGLLAVGAPSVKPADRTANAGEWAKARTPLAPGAPMGGPEAGSPRGALPQRFYMQIDAVGTFLMVRERRVTLGPISSSRRPDIALLAEADLPVATIERVEDDYFLSCERPVLVNDQPVTRKLLSGEDRIALSPRCRLKFTLPNAASTSAVLHLSGGARLANGDARRVVLMDQSLVIGPGASAHIRNDAMSEPVVIYAQDDRLLCRAKGEVAADGQPIEPAAGIPVGANVQVGPLSFVVTVA